MTEVCITADHRELGPDVIKQLVDELPMLGLEVLVNPIEDEETGNWIVDEDGLGDDAYMIIIRPRTIVETTVELFCREYDGHTEVNTFSKDKVDFLKETLEFFKLENHEKASGWKKEWNKILEERPSANLHSYIEKITGGDISYDGYMVDGAAMYRDELYLYIAWENYTIEE